MVERLVPDELWELFQRVVPPKPTLRLRHSALTHDTEDGTSTPMLLARSRHASVRSLKRYARPGVDAHVASRDPAARRRS
jgi:hypothetical protein